MFLRYLQAEKFIYEKGAIAIFEHYEWHKQTFPMHIDDPASRVWSNLNLGFLYIAKRDKKGRPIIIMNV
jgi:hypothetical protein